MWASPGDYVIRGVQHEFYPCKPDIFAATYEPVESVPVSDSPTNGGAKMDLTTLPECARRAGVEYRTLHAWVQKEVIVPSYPSEGAGHPMYFTPRETEVVGMLARMRAAGLESTS